MDPPHTESTGKNPTIATYIKNNGIKETLVEHGDAGAPTIGIPVPDGWEPAGEATPKNAYAAIVYKGSDAADPPPRIIAILTKLTGNIDPQTILDLAPGDLNNLRGYSGNESTSSALGEYPAYQLGGGYPDMANVRQLIQQKTVVLPSTDGLFVLQLNAYAADKDGDILGKAIAVVDEKTTITF